MADAKKLALDLMSREVHFPFTHKLAVYVLRETDEIERAEKELASYEAALATRLASLRKPPAAAGPELAASVRERVRPLRPGLSIAGVHRSAGTICCFVLDAEGRRYVLSSDDVLGNSPGFDVLQPGPLDGGVAEDRVGSVTKVITTAPDRPRTIAGAIAALEEDIEVSNEMPGGGAITGVASRVVLGQRLRAVGRTSGVVTTTVIAIEVDGVEIYGDKGPERFDGLIETEPFSQPGDSGAPLVNEEGKLVGFVYAGGDKNTFVMPIKPVLERLGVQLLL